jgi:hypothetical protein
MPDKVRNIESHHVATNSGANAAVTASIPAPTSGDGYAYLSGFFIELTSVGAPTGGVVTVTLTGVIGGPLTFTMNRGATALALLDSLNLNFQNPLKAAAPGTAITLSGNSGDASATLRLLIFGYHAPGK